MFLLDLSSLSGVKLVRSGLVLGTRGWVNIIFKGNYCATSKIYVGALHGNLIHL